MTTLQKTLVAASLVAAVGTGIYEARQASQLRREVQTIQQHQSLATNELAQLRIENDRLSNQLAQAGNSQTLSKAQFEELLRLRGQSGQAQAQAGEVARLKSAVADQAARADQLTNATAMGMEMAERAQMIRADAKLAVMKATLNLSEDQERSIREAMKRHARRRVEIAMESMSGKMTPQLREAAAAEKRDQESEIKALFTPEQVAAYPQFEQAEKFAAADSTANYQVGEISKDFGLSQEQQQQVRTAFAQLILKEPGRGPNPDAIGAAGSSGNLQDAFTRELESQKSQLEQRLKVLSALLTSDQLDAYREAQLKQINMMAGAMKTFVPPPPAESATSR